MFGFSHRCFQLLSRSTRGSSQTVTKFLISGPEFATSGYIQHFSRFKSATTSFHFQDGCAREKPGCTFCKKIIPEGEYEVKPVVVMWLNTFFMSSFTVRDNLTGRTVVHFTLQSSILRGVCMFSPAACVGFLLVLRFPPTSQKHAW